jgi:hypothetical protein
MLGPAGQALREHRVVLDQPQLVAVSAPRAAVKSRIAASMPA